MRGNSLIHSLFIPEVSPLQRALLVHIYQPIRSNFLAMMDDNECLVANRSNENSDVQT